MTQDFPREYVDALEKLNEGYFRKVEYSGYTYEKGSVEESSTTVGEATVTTESKEPDRVKFSITVELEGEKSAADDLHKTEKTPDKADQDKKD